MRIHEDKVHPVGDTKNDKQPTIIKFTKTKQEKWNYEKETKSETQK